MLFESTILEAALISPALRALLLLPVMGDRMEGPAEVWVGDITCWEKHGMGLGDVLAVGSCLSRSEWQF